MQIKHENREEMKKLQEEAIRHVQEMKSRIKKDKKEEFDLSSKSKRKFNFKKKKNENNILNSILNDSERNLILLLVLLLMEDNYDTGMILALMHLII